MPEKPAEIYDLLMTVLSEQGRAVTGFVSDGVNLLSGEQLPETFQRIEASSLSHRELTLQVIREFLDKNLRLPSFLLQKHSHHGVVRGFSANG